MTHEELSEVWEQIVAAVQRARDAIMQFIHDQTAAITKLYRSLPKSMKQLLRPRIARRKIRRYAQAYARRR